MSNFQFKHVLILLVVTVGIVWLTMGPQPVQTQLPTGAPSFPSLSASGPQFIPRFYFLSDSLASITGAMGPVPARQRQLKTQGGAGAGLRDTTGFFLTVGARMPSVLWLIKGQGTSGDSLNATINLQVTNNPQPNKNSSWTTIQKVSGASYDSFYAATPTTENARHFVLQTPDTVSYYMAARFIVRSYAADSTLYVIKPLVVYDDAGFLRSSRGNVGY